MSAKSKHYGDVIIWIEKVIDSCTHPLQEITARHLIQNFEKLYYEVDKSFSFELSSKLRTRLEAHRCK